MGEYRNPPIKKEEQLHHKSTNATHKNATHKKLLEQDNRNLLKIKDNIVLIFLKLTGKKIL